MTGPIGIPGLYNGMLAFSRAPDIDSLYSNDNIIDNTQFIDNYKITDGFTFIVITSARPELMSVINGFAFPQDGRYIIVINNTENMLGFQEEATTSNYDNRLFLGIGQGNVLKIDKNHSISFIYCANLTIATYNDEGIISDISGQNRWIKLYTT